MARRKKSSSPNIPEETLARARAQAGLSPLPESAEAAEDALETSLQDETRTSAENVQVAGLSMSNAGEIRVPRPRAGIGNVGVTGSALASTSARRSPRAVNPERARADLERKKSRGELDMQTISEALANPTKFPTEEALHAQYGFVLRDLRNMGGLALILVVVLVAISQFIA